MTSDATRELYNAVFQSMQPDESDDELLDVSIPSHLLVKVTPTYVTIFIRNIVITLWSSQGVGDR